MFQEQENKRQNLQNYANFLEEIRAFMKHRGICEVITNPLVKAVVPDAGVDPVGVDLQIGKRFLHTSPEWEMKKLLAPLSSAAKPESAALPETRPWACAWLHQVS